MKNQLCRITLHDAIVNGLVAETLVVVGRFVKIEPEELVKWEVPDPVEPDEPDTDIEVGYSKDRGKPLHIVYKNKEAELTKTLFRLFVCINEPYRKEGKTKFQFADISEGLTGDDCKMSDKAIERAVGRLGIALSQILAPFYLECLKGNLYVRKFGETVNKNVGNYNNFVNE